MAFEAWECSGGKRLKLMRRRISDFGVGMVSRLSLDPSPVSFTITLDGVWYSE